MENQKFIKKSLFIFLLFGGLVLFSNQVFSYNDTDTHPDLTEEIAKFYNYFYEPKITNEQIQLMRWGAWHEDAPPRWMNHYFDPVYNVGWEGKTIGGILAISSREWAQSPSRQAVYDNKKYLADIIFALEQSELADSDYSWQRALRDYAAGDENRAYQALGQILHLIEDATVPDHTRDDTHLPWPGTESPYEKWAYEYTSNNSLNLADNLKNQGYKPFGYNTLDEYFYKVAKYSNGYFFSEDTIFDEKYSNPKVLYWYKSGLSNGVPINYGMSTDEDGIDFRLVRSIGYTQWRNIIQPTTYHLDDKVLSDYWPRLSRQAVISGAGIVNLFQKEAEKFKKEHPELAQSKPQTLLDKITNAIKSSFSGIFKKSEDSGNSQKSAEENIQYPISLPKGDNTQRDSSVLPQNNSNNLNSTLGEVEGQNNEMPENSSLTENSNSQTDTNSETGAETNSTEYPKEPVYIKQVLDGDTVLTGNDKKLRYIGVDSPESGECFSEEARLKNKELTEKITLEAQRDVSDIDKYGRLLRYVWRADTFVNEYLVRYGYARVMSIEPDVKYKNLFSQAENEAKALKRGLWGECEKNLNQNNEINNQIGASNASSGPGYSTREGGSSPSPTVNQNNEQQQEQQEEEGDTTPPQAPVLTSSYQNNDVLGASADVDLDTAGVQIKLQGAAEALASVSISVNPVYETQATSEGDWEQVITLNEGLNTITFVAIDSSGNESEAATLNLYLDTQGPQTTIQLSNYKLTSPNFTVEWESEDDVETYDVQYKMGQSGLWQEWLSGAEDTQKDFLSYYDDVIYTFRARAKDSNGNTGPWVETEAPVSLKPVVINEIMYNPDPGDDDYYEYIELYNKSPVDIDLASWKLKTNNEQSLLPASDSWDSTIIKSGGYALIGDKPSKDDDPNIYDGYYSMPDYSENAIRLTIDDASLSLTNTKKEITLKNSDDEIIDELTYNDEYDSMYYKRWGANGNGKSLERINPYSLSIHKSNWAESNQGGTPNQQNSAFNQYARTYIPGDYKVEGTVIWAKSGSPYEVFANDYNGPSPKVTEDGVLIIEPGVIVKTYGKDKPALTIEGTLIADAPANSPIIFTSIKDDSYGGDTNDDGNTTQPEGGDWLGIAFKPESQNSVLRNVIFKFGAGSRSSSQFVESVIKIEEADVILDNITIEDTYYKTRGIHYENASANLTDCMMKNIGGVTIYIEGENAGGVIENCLFDASGAQNGGKYGVKISDGASPLLKNNKFIGNIYPVYILSAYPDFEDNEVQNNYYNAITIDAHSVFSKDTVWRKNLPYILTLDLILYWPATYIYPAVSPGSTLTLEPGVVIKPQTRHDYALGIEGTLIAQGTSGEPIVFTSIKDDEYGGDTNGDGSASAPSLGDWKQVVFKSSSSGSILDNVIMKFGRFKNNDPFELYNNHIEIEQGAGVDIKETVIY